MDIDTAVNEYRTWYGGWSRPLVDVQYSRPAIVNDSYGMAHPAAEAATAIADGTRTVIAKIDAIMADLTEQRKRLAAELERLEREGVPGL